jgi:hypothetical protein
MTNTEKTRKKRLQEGIDKLTKENQRYVLGILQALAFAQTQETVDKAIFPGCKARVKQAVIRI